MSKMTKWVVSINFLCIILFSLGTQLLAQSSLVPVYHQVYDWMHYQRVRGNLPFYNYEALPLTRNQIENLLESLNAEDLNRADKRVLESYKSEFSRKALDKNKHLLKPQTDYIIKAKDLILSQQENHIYVWENNKGAFVVDLFTGFGAINVREGETELSSPFYIQNGIRSFGSFDNSWGYHYEQFVAGSKGDNEVFSYVPFLSRNQKYLAGGDEKNHLEAMAGYQKNLFSLHIGRGTLKYGVGQTNNLVFSREGIPTDWIRFNVNSKYIKYTSIIGSLTWDFETVSPLPNVQSRTSPSRWVAHQRIQIQPASWVSFGFYELVVFSNREFEFAYANPVTRLSITEFNQGDQDNGFAGFEGVIRPLKGVEIFGELLIDDLGKTSDLFRWETKAVNSLFARFFGVSYASKFGTTMELNYQRVDPNIYAHKFQLNALTEKGFSLGSQIGPNADATMFRVEQWLSKRTRITAHYQYNRHGLNYFDENGEFVDAGGNVNTSYYVDQTTGKLSRQTIFLEGDLHRWNQYGMTIRYEPWRSIRLNIELAYRQMLQGNQMDDYLLSHFSIQIGY